MRWNDENYGNVRSLKVEILPKAGNLIWKPKIHLIK